MTATLFQRATRGAAAGALLAAIAIGVGVIRGALFLLTGGKMALPDLATVRAVAAYATGFTVAGAVVGAVLPYLRTGFSQYAGFALGGAIVGAALVLGETRVVTRVDWFIGPGLGAFFGCAMAYGWRQTPVDDDTT